ncbi:ABC transporter ATP-binding protein [Roseomonas alkaliterrae]|uniref:Putative ABC transport system ATP-binding protein n=1 Tax=Neoroseomonas alkaliterrae TaxID=1452450 RepID=A0A840Y773_9PROT|nr:ABC transporter ATP-binding protein [Neoroseomonas alkaliterrae]MBB5689744.1 putative ABC transport system ATP-binding protein [Neoroseomonas alkaliterrae]MBR0674888.1 ABC transporter ATP-binding protein [Neoroseomonas alkaliterrae]
MSGATAPLVQVEGIGRVFGAGETAVRALDGVDLSVGAGEVVGLKGPSGSGKSTLLNIIACILEPSAGRLLLGGETVWDGAWRVADLRRLRRERIGFIFQFHNLLPFLDATDNVALAMTLAGADVGTARARARDLLDYLQVGHRATAKPARLSGGEAQRVAIARALANRPRVILADEPTAALDSERARVVMDLLRQVAREQQAAILVVTHDEKIFDRFDRMVALRDGRLEAVA